MGFKEDMSDAIVNASATVMGDIFDAPTDDFVSSLNFVLTYSLQPLGPELEGIAMFFMALALLAGLGYSVILIAASRGNSLGSKAASALTTFFIPNRLFGMFLMGIGPEIIIFWALCSVGLAILIMSMMVFSIVDIIIIGIMTPGILVSSFITIQPAMSALASYCLLLMGALIFVRAGGALLFLFPRSRIVTGITRVFFINPLFPIAIATILLLTNIVANHMALPGLIEAYMIPVIELIIGFGYFVVLALALIVRSYHIEEITERAKVYAKKATVGTIVVGTAIASGGVAGATTASRVGTTMGVANASRNVIGSSESVQDAIDRKIERKKRRY